MSRVYELAKRFQNKYFGTIAFRLRAHAQVIDDNLSNDEKVLYVFCGQKGYSHKEIFSTCVVALTDKRIMIATKRVLWGYFLTTITPELFNDLKVQTGIIFGRVTIDTAKELVTISNLSKSSTTEIQGALTKYINQYKDKDEKDSE